MARSGMADLITQVRQLATLGEADYSVGGATYWSDDQIEDTLDRVRVEIWDEPAAKVPQVNSGGTTVYTEYRVPFQWMEQTTGGTAIFYLRDATGARIGTADYTVDYTSGRITFGADQAGSARYVTARSYDVYEAAALIWEAKAAHVADRFDFTADGAQFRMSQLVAQYERMAQRMRAKATTGGVGVGRFQRNDVGLQTWDTGAKTTRVTF